MSWFWLWVVRLPCGVLSVAFGAAAVYGIFDWSLGLSGVAVWAIIADAAHHLGMRARARRRRVAQLLALPPGFLFHEGDGSRGQRAA